MKSTTDFGGVNISTTAIATLTGAIVTECYGVVGMASKKFFRDNIAVLLKQENYSKGVVVKNNKDGLELDIYLILCYGFKLSEIVNEVQKKVKYEMSKALDTEITAVNVFVQGVKVMD